MGSPQSVVLDDGEHTFAIDQATGDTRVGVTAINRTREEAVFNRTTVDNSGDTAGLILAAVDYSIGEAVADFTSNGITANDLPVDIARNGSRVVTTFDVRTDNSALLDDTSIDTSDDTCHIGVTI